MENRAFVLNEADNVATAIAELTPGTAELVGAAAPQAIELREAIRHGHKLALRDIPAGKPVVKYGVVIGLASEPIARGAWVHLHNLESRYDERSGSLDLETGAPTEADAYE